MELAEYEKGRRWSLRTIDITSGERLQFRTGTAGDITDHIDEQCPSGKKWTIQVTVRIDETDA